MSPDDSQNQIYMISALRFYKSKFFKNWSKIAKNNPYFHEKIRMALKEHPHKN